jgi:ribonuclease BN (tRNA processing enzyme)
VISGDATPRSDLLQNCDGCDVLIHEVYTQASFDKVSPEWRQYREAFHTSTRQLAEIAKKATPDLLVLYHRANPVATRRAHKSVVKPVEKNKC